MKEKGRLVVKQNVIQCKDTIHIKEISICLRYLNNSNVMYYKLSNITLKPPGVLGSLWEGLFIFRELWSTGNQALEIYGALPKSKNKLNRSHLKGKASILFNFFVKCNFFILTCTSDWWRILFVVVNLLSLKLLITSLGCSECTRSHNFYHFFSPLARECESTSLQRKLHAWYVILSLVNYLIFIKTFEECWSDIYLLYLMKLKLNMHIWPNSNRKTTFYGYKKQMLSLCLEKNLV